MIEDYGNIDQLNYFVKYLYNAGATVVPFRPVGYQNTEIVLDQDDPQVTYTGSWTNSTGTPYYENGVTVSGGGVPFRIGLRERDRHGALHADYPHGRFLPGLCVGAQRFQPHHAEVPHRP